MLRFHLLACDLLAAMFGRDCLLPPQVARAQVNEAHILSVAILSAGACSPFTCRSPPLSSWRQVLHIWPSHGKCCSSGLYMAPLRPWA